MYYPIEWLRLVGSLKFKVSFAKEPYKRDLYPAKETYPKETCKRDLLQKRPIQKRPAKET